MVDRRSVLGLLGLSLLLLECVNGQTQIQSRTEFSELITLLSLRSALGIQSKDWPIKGDPCSVWRGIQCENGRVVGINIAGFVRTRIGKRNPQFAVDPLVNLTRLAYFNASRFSLPGKIPQWFGVQLLTLQVLDLSSCSITDDVPNTLGNLTTLQTLNLSGNSLTGAIPSSLGKLLNLSELDISGNSLSGSLPSSFGSLRNLSILDVSSNYLTGHIPKEIGMLSKLRYLNFSSNSFSNSIPPQLGELQNLEKLDLSFNALSGSIPEDLRRMKRLHTLMISDNLLSGALPINLFDARSQLQILALKMNAFTDTLPESYWLLPKLRILDVSSNNFTGLLPNYSSDVNVGVAELDISKNMFYGGLTPILTRFRTMDLSENYFEGKLPNYVVRANASLTGNCLQSARLQKTFAGCESFYSARGLVFDDFKLSDSTEPPKESSSSGLSHRAIVILAAVAGGISLILIFIVSPILIALCLRSRGGTAQRGNGVGPSPAEEASEPPRALDLSRLGNSFTYGQLVRATGEFNEANLIKHGHSGDLFCGILENGTSVVIKRVDLREDKERYVSELEFFSKAGQRSLVPLLGHYLENESQKFLVYKFMRNRDLGSSLFRKSNNDENGLQSLDWITRLKIALGAAECLSYLHHECSPPLVHRDVQASSILLDDKFEVRLGSLSDGCGQDDAPQNRMSRFLRLPQSSEPGTSGQGTATCAHDVYCFGKVLLELVTGKLGLSSPEESAETKEVMEETLSYISVNTKELMNKILDPSLIVDEDLLEEVWAMAIIAKSCLNPKPSGRPLMRHIVVALENPVRVVREENSGSSRLRTNSLRGSWNADAFGSWRKGSSYITVAQPGGDAARGGTSSGRLRKSGRHDSGQNGNLNSKEVVGESFLL